ncbi:MAG: acyltransferase family protein [Micrococcus sp.]|nr:acyltransferase family protein [Micrococcus sp.]
MGLSSPAMEREPASGTARNAPRRDIQGLRALAVLVVFLDHLTGWPRGGFVGVDIFFVISGFLITGLLLREHERTGTISFRSFYRRRIKRILPASVLVLFVTVIAASLLFPVTRTVSTMGDALWSLIFAGNWRFALSGTDYFQEGTLPSPLQHYWSLGVEEQFYLLWPWMLLGILLMLARCHARPPVRRGTVGITILLILASSFAWALAETASEPTLAYFSTASRAWELALGAFLAIAAPAFGPVPERLRSPLAWLGLGGMVASILWLAPGQAGFPAPLAAFPVLSAALVIVAGTGARSPGPWPLTNPVSGYIGDISFSLYLWHWPVMVLLAAVASTDGIRYYLWAPVLSILLSVVSYHLVEDPLRRARWLGGGRDRGRRGFRSIPVRAAATVAVASVAGVGIVLGALAIRWDNAGPEAGSPGGDTEVVEDGSVTPESVRAGAAGTADVAPVTDHETDCLGAASVHTGTDCDGALGDGLWPSAETFAADTSGQFKCWRPEGGQAFPDCTLGDPGGTVRVALLGDSHAASYLPAIEAIAEGHGWKLDVFTGLACHWYAHDPEDDCYGPLQDANEALLSGEPYDAVLAVSSRYDESHPLPELVDRYAQAWKPVAERGTQVIAISDVPATSEESIQCLTRIGFSVTDNECGVARQEGLARADPLPQAASRVAGAGVVDLTEYFCSQDFCPAVIGHVVVYRDAHAHLSATYARTLTPFLEEDLLALLDR